MSGIRRLAIRSGLIGLATRARVGQPLILMYHGVSSNPGPRGLRNASNLHLTREKFVEHLRTLRRHRRVIGITEMVEGLRDGADLRSTVALTFDDGYANNVVEAAPLLVDHKMPAAFFLATSYIGTDRWIWNDLLEHALDVTRASKVSFNTRVLSLASLEDKRATLQTIKSHMKQLSVLERDRQIEEITGSLAPGIGTPMGDYRFMDWREARQLVDGGFEVGAHSVNHAILSQVSAQQAELEILKSRDHIMSATGRCCPVFCYPNGKRADYNDAAIEVCRRHFIAALSTNRGPARRDDLFELSRLGTDGGAEDLLMVLFRER